MLGLGDLAFKVDKDELREIRSVRPFSATLIEYHRLGMFNGKK
jgi:hypothetical protein